MRPDFCRQLHHIGLKIPNILGLFESGAVAEVIDRTQLESLGADPGAELMLEAAPGHYFSDRIEGAVVRASVKDRGAHGRLPTRAGLEGIFTIISGFFSSCSSSRNLSHSPSSSEPCFCFSMQWRNVY